MKNKIFLHLRYLRFSLPCLLHINLHFICHVIHFTTRRQWKQECHAIQAAKKSCTGEVNFCLLNIAPFGAIAISRLWWCCIFTHIYKSQLELVWRHYRHCFEKRILLKWNLLLKYHFSNCSVGVSRKTIVSTFFWTWSYSIDINFMNLYRAVL